MTSCCFVCSANCADSGRANASVPPPAGKGTMICTGLAGQADDCAWTDAQDVAPGGADGMHVLGLLWFSGMPGRNANGTGPRWRRPWGFLPATAWPGACPDAWDRTDSSP